MFSSLLHVLWFTHHISIQSVPLFKIFCSWSFKLKFESSNLHVFRLKLVMYTVEAYIIFGQFVLNRSPKNVFHIMRSYD